MPFFATDCPVTPLESPLYRHRLLGIEEWYDYQLYAKGYVINIRMR